MHRPKLQICTEILSTLASNGPMTLRKISERLDLKEKFLKKHLKLLQDSSFIIKENFGTQKIFFTITENGLRLQNTISEKTNPKKIKLKTVEIAL